MRRQVGQFSSHIINLLELDIEVGTPIYISDTNIEHMKSSHPNDFIKYGNDIEHIISTPDYVGKNIKIKAAGGISSIADAEKFISLGADRLGTSRIVKIVKSNWI